MLEYVELPVKKFIKSFFLVYLWLLFETPFHPFPLFDRLFSLTLHAQEKELSKPLNSEEGYGDEFLDVQFEMVVHISSAKFDKAVI